MKRIILCILLSALIAVSLVSGLEQLPFKNAILLEDGVFNPFGIRLNDSNEVIGDINVNLVNNTDNNFNLNFIGYSSKNSINVDDVVFYKQDGSSLSYQDAKSNNWIEGINESIETIIGEETTILIEYGAYWVHSFLAVNMTFPNVGGSNVSQVIARDDLIVYNGTDFRSYLDAESLGWIGSLRFWNPTGRGGGVFVNIDSGENLNTWVGHVIFSDFDNIFLLFENTTIQPPNIIMRYDDGNDTAIVPQNMIERFDDGTIEITMPKNIFRRIVRWIRNLA